MASIENKAKTFKKCSLRKTVKRFTKHTFPNHFFIKIKIIKKHTIGIWVIENNNNETVDRKSDRRKGNIAVILGKIKIMTLFLHYTNIDHA